MFLFDKYIGDHWADRAKVKKSAHFSSRAKFWAEVFVPKPAQNGPAVRAFRVELKKSTKIMHKNAIPNSPKNLNLRAGSDPIWGQKNSAQNPSKIKSGQSNFDHL